MQCPPKTTQSSTFNTPAWIKHCTDPADKIWDFDVPNAGKLPAADVPLVVGSPCASDGRKTWPHGGEFLPDAAVDERLAAYMDQQVRFRGWSAAERAKVPSIVAKVTARLSPVMASAVAALKAGDGAIKEEAWWLAREAGSLNSLLSSGHSRLGDRRGSYFGVGAQGGKVVLAYSGHTKNFGSRILSGHLPSIEAEQKEPWDRVCLHYQEAARCDWVKYWPAAILEDDDDDNAMLVAEWWAASLFGTYKTSGLTSPGALLALVRPSSSASVARSTAKPSIRCWLASPNSGSASTSTGTKRPTSWALFPAFRCCER